MRLRGGIARSFLLIGLIALSSGGCTFLSTGARSATVVLVPEENSATKLARPDLPALTDLRSLLARHFLWLAPEDRAAQWIAYVEVRPSPLESSRLKLIAVKKNPNWQPLAVSDPISRVNNGANSGYYVDSTSGQWRR